MSRDRLRDIRANQQGGNGGPQQQYTQQNYAPQQQYDQGNAPQQQYNPQQNYAPPQQSYPPYSQGAPTQDVMQGFFAEVESIQDDIKLLNSNIQSVGELHSRRLATTDESQQANSTAQLTQLTAQTSSLTQSLRNRITKLNDTNKRSKKGDPDFNVRKTQIGSLQSSFKRALEEYNLVEKRSRDKYRQRMERQIKIVKPDATQDEIRAAFDDNSGGQIFSQALVQSRQSGARAAFAEVQSRNLDLRKIEETMTQLAQMMQDMAMLILEQDESVIAIEDNANKTSGDMAQGLVETQKAVKSARSARTKRWICFFIIITILAIIAIVLAVHFTNQNKK